ncbi:MAG: hypothetical protein HY965_04085 [Ignavibacteriales bacterium]|nr:hypothetical protein [Ignavibacteriales bacterium]
MLKNGTAKFAILTASLCISFFVCEVILQLVAGEQFFIWYPNLREYFTPSASIFPGVKDTSLFKINSIGLRGAEKKAGEVIHIVTIGGSTTECLYLDQEETWPTVLEKYLDQGTGKQYQVLNGGRSALNSQHHLLQIQKLLNQEQWIDEFIVLQGINDLQYALSLGDNYKKKESNIVYNESFLVSPLNKKLPFYKRSYLYSYFNKIRSQLKSIQLGQDPNGRAYNLWRENRINARKIVDTISGLEQPLSDYRETIVSIINLVKTSKRKVTFLTQPSAWNDTLSHDMEKLCWMGWIGKNQNENSGHYYSFRQLKKAMDKYNSLLKSICAAHNVVCIDLEKNLSKDTTTFYDDCHFNERGAEKVAGMIYSVIK